ncbi:uncharacterized protein LOC131877807 [Tigriopus californicus]|uniref:uncharacterized protein LOC131877807 n=1 Tax=Tigriopus californicus TaxID=6832 RepID=UPI0027DA071C|nr:uncharacterized protein LOC131877807 [Tigriopus californicus]
MDIIQAELDELRRICQKSVPDSTLITCALAQVRVQIKKSDFTCVTACFTFPKDYPRHNILIELKSKTLSVKLLDGLVKVSETEAQKHLDRPHILPMVKFINKFLDENPLSCCADEISEVKAKLDGEERLKLSQKTASMSLFLKRRQYFLKLKFAVPPNYPIQQIQVVNADSNFPRVFRVWFVAQAQEVARRCVEPPLRPKPKAPPFKVRPSFGSACSFLIESVHRYPDEICQICRQKCFPEDPEQAIHDENAAAHVERVYCSHCYHHDCLILYMKTPPFEGGKKCIACKQKIYHEIWKVTPELAEARWAHEQAKNRELDEVVDFLADMGDNLVKPS